MNMVLLEEVSGSLDFNNNYQLQSVVMPKLKFVRGDFQIRLSAVIPVAYPISVEVPLLQIVKGNVVLSGYHSPRASCASFPSLTRAEGAIKMVNPADWAR